ncbi:uncharacterized protein LOC111345977 [Stylophora pistillata]|uniref:uncharacterized protein LOC111345977 n=1 Tax=Stylophora pistillata TaxID=50429 RepID=UPI000C0559F0|nr:uncharacterized protein LOC111345977 [Stylophora pistillata]
MCTNERGSYMCKCKPGYVGDGFDCNSYAGLGYSAILAKDDHYHKTLSIWLSPVVQSQSSYWKRCWRASVDGWAASTFHSFCDSKGPTVTIIRVGKYIFGGYTSLSWTSSWEYQYSSSAFLFSLVNKPGWGPVKLTQQGKYSYRKKHSIYSCSSVGPTFGRAHDIYISDYASSNTNSLSDPGYTYSPPSGHIYSGSFTRSFLAGTSSCVHQYSSSAFLFSLVSLVNKPGWGPVKLSRTGKYSSRRYSIYSCSSYGPTFGGGHDLYILNYASSNTRSYTNLGYTYSPPSGHSYGSSFTRSFLARSYKFQPDEVEVFYETT